MGVYVFKVKNSNCIKIGYTEHSNPWYRVAFRGFANVILPQEIYSEAHFRNLELLYWLNNLDMQSEKLLHKKFEQYKLVGEWFNYEKIKEDKFFKKSIVDKSSMKGVNKEEAIRTIQHNMVRNKLASGGDCIKELIDDRCYDIDSILDRIQESLWNGRGKVRVEVE